MTRVIQQMAEDGVDVGGRPEKAPDEEFISAVKSIGTAETSEVQEEIERRTGWDVSRSQVGRRLDDLVAEGKLVKKNKGRGKSNTWMLPETFEAIVPDDRFISVMGDGMMTAEEVSDEIGLDEGAVLRRLQKLEDERRVESKRPRGSGSAVWMVRD